MDGLTLTQAMEIANGALAKAREMGYKPLTVAVVDAGGCLKVLLREDGSSILRPDIAFAKAWGAVGMGMGGRAMAKRASDAPQFWAALNAISSGRIAPVPGGVLILEAGQVMGSVGISGDISENDEACAIAGIEKAGLEAEVGEGALGKQ
ncbi:MAG TPA: heme-binding protein [Ktedonobacteraceae bacterium]